MAPKRKAGRRGSRGSSAGRRSTDVQGASQETGAVRARLEEARAASSSNGHAAGAGGGMAAEFLQVNAVRIDEDQLAAETEQVAAEATQDAAAAAADLPPTAADEAAAVQIANAEEGYKILALAVVGQGYELFAPAWHVTPLEKSDMSDALVAALLLWFPDGLIPPKYMALLVIAGIGAKIAIARRDPVTGLLAPRHDLDAAATATAH